MAARLRAEWHSAPAQGRPFRQTEYHSVLHFYSMPYPDSQQLPAELKPALAKAHKLEWLTLAYQVSVVVVMYLSLGQSQAMKTAWADDMLGMIAPTAIGFLELFFAHLFFNCFAAFLAGFDVLLVLGLLVWAGRYAVLVCVGGAFGLAAFFTGLYVLLVVAAALLLLVGCHVIWNEKI